MNAETKLAELSTDLNDEGVAPESDAAPPEPPDPKEVARATYGAIDATYSPEDNKLRLRSVRRLPRDLYERVRAAGFIWAPKQDLLVAPAWTPQREDLALALAGEVGDEDTSLVERAEERADRFEDYRDKRADDADRAHAAVSRIADNIPLGQAILVGHHSERRARRDAKKIENGMRRALSMWETSKYWEQRAKGALRLAKYKERDDVRHRRIKGLESDKRKHEKRLADSEQMTRLWQKEGLTLAQATYIANRDSIHIPDADRERIGDWSLWSALDKGKVTVEVASAYAAAVHQRIARDAERWLAHLGNRLAYERAMMAESVSEGGGMITDHFEIEVGGKVHAKHWRTSYREEWLVVTRVNRANDAIQSVSTPRGVIPIEDVKGYRAADPEEVAKVKASHKLPPLVNYPGEGFVEMTRAQWDRRAADEKKAHTAKATETHGRYRYRQSWVPGGGFRTAQVFLTDAKIVERPTLDGNVPRVTFEREAVAPQEQPARPAYAAPEPTRFDALKDSLNAGVQVVQADQLFATPGALAERMVELAEIAPGRTVLEPSAGTGSIVRALRGRGATVAAVEIDARLAAALPLQHTIAADFLSIGPSDVPLAPFDAVVMNPPFARSADIAHVTHAIRFLKPGGRLVAVMSAGVRFREDKRSAAFRALIRSHGGTMEELPKDTFATSGTSVSTVLVTLRGLP